MRRALALVLFTLLLAGGVLAVPAARSASPDVVVSQVFAGGGNAGAPFTNDFDGRSNSCCLTPVKLPAPLSPIDQIEFAAVALGRPMSSAHTEK